jgi:hypothetical protein
VKHPFSRDIPVQNMNLVRLDNKNLDVAVDNIVSMAVGQGGAHL